MKLEKNNYWVMRHGFSKANEQGRIVSILANGIQECYALTELGKQQASEAGLKLKEQLRASGSDRPFIVYYSPFSRTRETAAIAAQELGLELIPGHFEPADALVERYFGKDLELQDHVNGYNAVWSADERDPTSRPGSDGESLQEVAARVEKFLQELEAKHAGANILLVSHGDTLSITRALCSGAPLSQHRNFKMTQAEFCCLN